MRINLFIQINLLGLLVLMPVLSSCAQPGSSLEQVKKTGVLLVATRHSQTTYHKGPDGYEGLEHDLVQLFAESLGVKALFIVPPYFQDILTAVQQGTANFAAAGLTVTPERSQLFAFSPSYQEITQQVIYKSGNLRPRKVTGLIGRQLEVLAGSSHEQELERLLSDHPDLLWVSSKTAESLDLLMKVKAGELELTIADSNEAALTRRYHPELKVAFSLTEPQPLAWVFKKGDDTSLLQAASEFIETIKADGRLKQLIERYYGYVDRLTLVDTYRFKRHVKSRLPQYAAFFKQAGQVTDIDWRLLAVMGYQESHWNPKAVSPTGVRGIMMLTQATAKQLGIANRMDPEQSIRGGAQYMKLLEAKLPERINEADKLWMTLAGYNVGFGHLEDARVLTELQGADTDKWSEVKERLPLLRKKEWYSKTKYRYARGDEAVDYVDSIRSYYALLKWLLNKKEYSDLLEGADYSASIPKKSD